MRASGARLDVAPVTARPAKHLIAAPVSRRDGDVLTGGEKGNAPAVSLAPRARAGEDPERGCLRDTPWLLLMLGVVSIEKPNYTESKGTEYLVNTGHISSISSN